MENNNRDYIFYLNWEDNIKNVRKVGYLAHIDESFYLLVSGRENAKTAYENGFVGMPGFISGRIYKSQELFSFFKNRILDKDSDDPCKELLMNEGKSMIDSFSLAEVPEALAEKQKQVLLKAYEIQEEKKRIQLENAAVSHAI